MNVQRQETRRHSSRHCSKPKARFRSGHDGQTPSMVFEEGEFRCNVRFRHEQTDHKGGGPFIAGTVEHGDLDPCWADKVVFVKGYDPRRPATFTGQLPADGEQWVCDLLRVTHPANANKGVLQVRLVQKNHAEIRLVPVGPVVNGEQRHELALFNGAERCIYPHSINERGEVTWHLYRKDEAGVYHLWNPQSQQYEMYSVQMRAEAMKQLRKYQQMFQLLGRRFDNPVISEGLIDLRNELNEAYEEQKADVIKKLSSLVSEWRITLDEQYNIDADDVVRHGMLVSKRGIDDEGNLVQTFELHVKAEYAFTVASRQLTKGGFAKYDNGWMLVSLEPLTDNSHVRCRIRVVPVRHGKGTQWSRISLVAYVYCVEDQGTWEFGVAQDLYEEAFFHMISQLKLPRWEFLGDALPIEVTERMEQVVQCAQNRGWGMACLELALLNEMLEQVTFTKGKSNDAAVNTVRASDVNPFTQWGPLKKGTFTCRCGNKQKASKKLQRQRQQQILACSSCKNEGWVYAPAQPVAVENPFPEFLKMLNSLG